MTVTLPTDLEEFVAQGIAKGRFKAPQIPRARRWATTPFNAQSDCFVTTMKNAE